MKKLFWVLLVLGVFAHSLTAQGIGAYFCNSYPAGKWAEYVKTSVGGGVSAEYTLPLNLDSFDLGLNLRAEYSMLIAKKTELISSAGDITVLPGLFVSVPFAIGSMDAAFVADLSYGAVIHNIKGMDSSGLNGIYVDQLMGVSAGVRLGMPALEQLQLELAPCYTFAFEDSRLLMQAGFRLGVIWRFDY